MKANLPIEIDPEIMSGAPVFRGTRVPVQSLFEYLEDNLSLDEFLDCFPTVRREDAIAVLEHSKSELLVPAWKFSLTNACRSRCAAVWRSLKFPRRRRWAGGA